MSISKLEKETIINFNEAEDMASVYTFNVKLIHRLEQLAVDHPDECKQTSRKWADGAVDYEIPKKWVKISPPPVREYTDEQREQMRQAAIKRFHSDP